MIVRSDCGTENASLAACHMLLRHSHTDLFSKDKSYRYGSSTTNTVSCPFFCYTMSYNYKQCVYQEDRELVGTATKICVRLLDEHI